MKMNKHVAKWANKNFSLSKPKAVDLSAKAKQFNSEMISTVHEGSPAYFLGIKPGWILISIDGRAYTKSSIFMKKFQTKKSVRAKFEIYDPVKKHRYILKGKHWPFGIVLTKPPAKISEDLTKGSGTSTWADIHSLWGLGLIAEIGEIYPALELVCARLARRPKPTTLPPPNEPLPPGAHIDALSSLSIAAFAAGHIERADYIFRLTEARIKQGGGMSNFSTSMHYYVGSLLSDLKGQHEQAILYARRSFKRTPNVLEVRKNLETLTGETHAPVKSDFGKNFEMDYQLPNLDPVGVFQSSDKILSFRESLNQLGENQLLLVLVMGHYRSNGYYLEDIIAAAPIFKVFRHKVKAVHVICEGNYEPNPDGRQEDEKLARAFAMPIHILFDEDKNVSKQINATGYPSRFFFNKKGEILSEKQLWDETGIWEAFRNS